MKLDVPFYSQLDTLIPQDLQRISCALICIKMVMEYKNVKLSFDEIYKEACAIGGKESVGWNHETLVRLLRNHGILAYRQEFYAQKKDIKTLQVFPSEFLEKFIEEGIKKIKESIDKNNPVLVSVVAGFSQDFQQKKSLNSGHHVVLITGYSEDMLFCNDPIFDNSVSITYEHFIKFWRKFTVIVE